jgi:hypothetical protein
MAYGLKAFQRFQVSNVEGTVGTAEAAVEILYGMIKAPTHDNVKYQPEQDRNTLAMHAEAPFDVSKTLEFEITGELYDRLAIWMFSNAIRGNVTPSQPDNMNEPLHYLWLFEPSLATNPNTPDATNGIDTFTFEYGDNIQAYEVEYGFTIGLEISGVPNEPVQFTWNLGGRQVTATTFTGALTEPARKAFFAFNSANYYIDTANADIGDTLQAGMLKGFTYKFETQFTPPSSRDA